MRTKNADLASFQLIVNTYMEMGLELIVGGQHAVINLTRLFLTGDIPLPISLEQAALEVAQNIGGNAARTRLQGCSTARAGEPHHRHRAYTQAYLESGALGSNKLLQSISTR